MQFVIVGICWHSRIQSNSVVHVFKLSKWRFPNVSHYEGLSLTCHQWLCIRSVHESYTVLTSALPVGAHARYWMLWGRSLPYTVLHGTQFVIVIEHKIQMVIHNFDKNKTFVILLLNFANYQLSQCQVCIQYTGLQCIPEIRLWTNKNTHGVSMWEML